MSTATAQIHLRPLPGTQSLLKRAAELSGSGNLTDYVLRAAVEKARGDLMSQQTFALNGAQWREFQKRLDAKSLDLPRLRALLNSLDVFDRAAQKA